MSILGGRVAAMTNVVRGDFFVGTVGGGAAIPMQWQRVEPEHFAEPTRDIHAFVIQNPLFDIRYSKTERAENRLNGSYGQTGKRANGHGGQTGTAGEWALCASGGSSTDAPLRTKINHSAF